MFNNNNSSKSLQNKSSKILGIFTKTVEDLQQVNADANLEITKKEKKKKKIIEEATIEKNSLNELTSANYKIIEKIKNIIE